MDLRDQFDAAQTRISGLEAELAKERTLRQDAQNLGQRMVDQRDALAAALIYLLEVRGIMCLHPDPTEYDESCANCKAIAALAGIPTPPTENELRTTIDRTARVRELGLAVTAERNKVARLEAVVERLLQEDDLWKNRPFGKKEVERILASIRRPLEEVPDGKVHS